MSTRFGKTVVFVSIVVVVFSAVFYVVNQNSVISPNFTDNNQSQLTNSESVDEEKSLQYLLEEEKLAYDVYMYFYEKYDAKIFSNIARSELTHQDRVFSLIESRSIEDTRKDARGVFTDNELQDFYDELILKGNRSLKDAFEVGVMIEEKDIADLTTFKESTNDTEIIAVLEQLIKASNNHLQSFQKQL